MVPNGFQAAALWELHSRCKKKVKGQPRTGHEGPEVE